MRVKVLSIIVIGLLAGNLSALENVNQNSKASSNNNIKKEATLENSSAELSHNTKPAGFSGQELYDEQFGAGRPIQIGDGGGQFETGGGQFDFGGGQPGFGGGQPDFGGGQPGFGGGQIDFGGGQPGFGGGQPGFGGGQPGFGGGQPGFGGGQPGFGGGQPGFGGGQIDFGGGQPGFGGGQPGFGGSLPRGALTPPQNTIPNPHGLPPRYLKTLGESGGAGGLIDIYTEDDVPKSFWDGKIGNRPDGSYQRNRLTRGVYIGGVRIPVGARGCSTSIFQWAFKHTITHVTQDILDILDMTLHGDPASLSVWLLEFGYMHTIGLIEDVFNLVNPINLANSIAQLAGGKREGFCIAYTVEKFEDYKIKRSLGLHNKKR